MRAAALWLALGIGCLILAFYPRGNPAVDAARQFNQDVAIASGATYVSLRAINAALSMAQEVELGGSLGVSGNLKPLKWLEPVDDTVEMVSATIFAVAVLTGILSLAMGPVAAVGFFLVGVGFLGRCGCALAGAKWPSVPLWLGNRLNGCIGIGLLLAIGIPLAFALGGWIGEGLTRPVWAEAEATLDRIAGAARALIGEPGSGGESPGWREAFNGYLTAAGLFWDEADELLQASLTLVGVFVLRTVVLPLVLIVALAQMLRGRLGDATGVMGSGHVRTG